MAYAETPFGNALAQMGSGERCAVGTVLVCPSCATVYPDDRDDPGNCGPCEWSYRWTYAPTHFHLRRRKRRADDALSVAFRF